MHLLVIPSDSLRPRKAKPPVRIDAEQQAANAHYFTVFKIVLKITVIALVICIAFLPTVALRNKHKHQANEHPVKDLQHPSNFDISAELERDVTHVPIRYVKTGKLLVQQLHIRDSISDDFTKTFGNEQTGRSDRVANVTADGIHGGDYTLEGSTHQARSGEKSTQKLLPDEATRSGEDSDTQLILPTRDDDLVVPGGCSWQERRKHSGRCSSTHWQSTPRRLIVSEDLNQPKAERRSDKSSQPKSTLWTLTRSSLPTSMPKVRIVETCSYESAIKNGGKCPLGLINDPESAQRKPFSLSIKAAEHCTSNIEHQRRNADPFGELEGVTAAYQNDTCQSPWIHTTDGWCIFRWGENGDSLRIAFPNSEERAQLYGPGAEDRENKGMTVSYRADSCPHPFIRTADGRCVCRLGDNDGPVKIIFVPRPVYLSPNNRRGGPLSDQTIDITAAYPADSCSLPWIYRNGWCFQIFGDDVHPSDVPISEYLGPQQHQRRQPFNQNDVIASYEAASPDSCPQPWQYGMTRRFRFCYYVWVNMDPLRVSALGPQKQPTGAVPNHKDISVYYRMPYGANNCPYPWLESEFQPLQMHMCSYTFEAGTDPSRIVSALHQRHERKVKKTKSSSSLVPVSTSTSACACACASVSSFTSALIPASTSVSIYTTTTSVSMPPPTGGSCEPPWIRIMDGRCFFDPNYQQEHLDDPLSQPKGSYLRKPGPQRRREAMNERGVAPSWQADSCEPPWIHTSDNWCIYLPGYKHGMQNSFPGPVNATIRASLTEQASSTTQTSIKEQPSSTAQPTVTEEPTVTEQASSTAQPTTTEALAVTEIAHCFNDSEGHLHCVKGAKRTRQVSSVHNRRGFWPDDWVPQIAEDCNRFIGNTYMHYECLQSVKHKNIGLKLIMFFLILAGFGSLVFLIITCVNRAARPKAQPFRPIYSLTNGMMDHTTSMCGDYPWNNNAALKPMNGDRWTRSPPAYDPMSQYPDDRSGSLVACARDRNGVSASSGDDSIGDESWIRKLCNRCFKSCSSGTSDSAQMLGASGNGNMVKGPRIDTLRLPNSNLATVRRANGLVPSEENGHITGSGSVSVRGQSAESAESAGSAETVLIGTNHGHQISKGVGSPVGTPKIIVGYYIDSPMRSSVPIKGCGVVGIKREGEEENGGEGPGSGNALSRVETSQFTQHGNLSSGPLIVPEPAVMKCGTGNAHVSPGGNLKSSCVKTGIVKKVEFKGLGKLEEGEEFEDLEIRENGDVGMENENIR